MLRFIKKPRVCTTTRQIDGEEGYPIACERDPRGVVKSGRKEYGI